MNKDLGLQSLGDLQPITEASEPATQSGTPATTPARSIQESFHILMSQDFLQFSMIHNHPLNIKMAMLLPHGTSDRIATGLGGGNLLTLIVMQVMSSKQWLEHNIPVIAFHRDAISTLVGLTTISQLQVDPQHNILDTSYAAKLYVSANRTVDMIMELYEDPENLQPVDTVTEETKAFLFKRTKELIATYGEKR